MESLARGLSKNRTPLEVADREARIETIKEAKCNCNAEEFFAELVFEKLCEQRESCKGTGSFFSDSGEGYVIEPSPNGFKIEMTYDEDGHSYEKSAVWDRGKAKLTSLECKHL